MELETVRRGVSLLEMHTSTKSLSEHAAEQEELQRVLLEPLVTSFASAFMARVIAGRALTGLDPGNWVKDFLLSKPERVQLLCKMIDAGQLNYTATEFAAFADANEALLNGKPRVSLPRSRTELICLF